jgi:hypothetical protein
VKDIPHRGTIVAEDQDPLVIPVPGDDSAFQEEPVMAEPTANQGLAAELIGQSMGQLSGTAAVAQNNFVTVNKALDYDFVEGKRVVDLVEALGGREIGSKTVPAGPTTVG